MDFYRGTAAIDRRLRRPVLTIGNFDGLHLGHQAIIATVVERARAVEGEAVLYTFDPHPRKVLQPGHAPQLLATLDQKLELLEALGIDAVVAEPFDRAFAATPPDRFVREHVHQGIDPIEVYVGYDFHFGRDREGSMRMLTETGPLLGFGVTIIPEVTIGARDVNSTRIRSLIAEGEMAAAAELLGRPYRIRGPVVSGDRRGRTLGFPTANLAPENEILPAVGVYAGRLRILTEEGAVERPAVTNVGYRPTFRDGRDLVAEAHLIDFSGDLYDEVVELSFECKLRDEQRFESAEALKEQIGRDVAEARIRLEVE